VIFIAGGQFLSLAHCFIVFVTGVPWRCRTNKKVQYVIELRAAPQKRPGGAFLGRGLANLPGRTKP